MSVFARPRAAEHPARRIHPRALAIAAALATLPAIAASPTHLDIGEDPQLFLDKYVVSHTEGLAYTLHHPARHGGNPILDSKTFGTTQPYLTVLHDRTLGKYRLWYNKGNQIGHVESTDGIRWINDRVAWDLDRCYGCSIIDDAGRDPDPNRRFKFAAWMATRSKEDKPGDDGGMWVGFSPDGFKWTRIDHPVLPGWPEDYPNWTDYGIGDIVDVFYDPIRGHYAASVKLNALAADGYIPGPKARDAIRRLIGMSTSDDFLKWKRPWRTMIADSMDEGLTEFYNIGGMHARGKLLIGFVRVLRDDLPHEPNAAAEGIGYASLAISRDGRSWHRFREPFLDRNPQPGSWDRAMTWISDELPIGDEVFLYYGGYARGHKIEPRSERQIGVARIRKDGYMSLRAGSAGGWMRTHPLVFHGRRLEVNLDPGKTGQLRVEIQDIAGNPAPGYTLDDCDAIRSNSVAGKVTWRGQADVGRLAGKVVRLKFVLSDADLYAFQFRSD